MFFEKINANENFKLQRQKLKKCYNTIFNNIVKKTGVIESGNLKFNNHIGDITKGIKWTWAINENSIDLFEKCVDSLKPMINKSFKNKFNIFGASFITLNKKEVKDSEFHLDVNSFDDMKEETNILTLIFPLYIEDDMGGLEYMDNREKKIYKYNFDDVIVWDACKLMHRTQPYRLEKKKRRVLVSINLVSDEEWAIRSISNTLIYQGNL